MQQAIHIRYQLAAASFAGDVRVVAAGRPTLAIRLIPATSAASRSWATIPVAYFTDGQPRKGTEEFTYEWLGTPWYFASAEHRDLFAGRPG